MSKALEAIDSYGKGGLETQRKFHEVTCEVIHQNQPLLYSILSSTTPFLSVSLFVVTRPDKMTGCRQRLGIKPLFRRNYPVPNYDPFTNDDCQLFDRSPPACLLIVISHSLTFLSPSCSPSLSLSRNFLLHPLCSVNICSRVQINHPFHGAQVFGFKTGLGSRVSCLVALILSTNVDGRGGPMFTGQVFVRVIWRTTSFPNFLRKGSSQVFRSASMSFKGRYSGVVERGTFTKDF